MKHTQTILLSITIALLIYIAFGIGRTDKPPSNSAILDSLYKITYRIAMNVDRFDAISDSFKQHDTVIIHHWNTIIEKLPETTIPQYSTMYDSITGSQVIATDSTICFDKPQMDTITTKIYEGERASERLINCQMVVITQDSAMVSRDTLISVQRSIIEVKDVEIHQERKTKRKWAVLSIVEAVLIGLLVVK